MVTSGTACQRLMLGDPGPFVPPGDAIALAAKPPGNRAAVALLAWWAYQPARAEFSPATVVALLEACLRSGVPRVPS